MPGLRFFHSNRQETLVSLLAEVLKNPLSDPLQPEIIMTQSLGMRKWLSLNLARMLGIAANMRLKFPNQILQDVFEALIPDFDPQVRQQRELIAWKIMEILPDCLDDPEFRPLKSYLEEGGKASRIMSWQLAGRIAYLFDQYAVCRPDMVRKWESEEETEGWQSRLWNLLQRICREPHFAALARKALENADNAETEQLPERISLFGVGYLPPAHLDILAALSRHVEVNIFFLNPCRQFWLDIQSEKEIVRALSRDRRADLTEEDLYLEKGNSLLASWGKSGRDFFRILMNYDYDELEEYEDSDDETGDALKSAQSHIFNLLEGGEDSPPEIFSPSDKSIQVHSCHSRRRETEILRDQLLLMIDSDPDLKPEDILVMAPNINPYIPFIKSVFQTPVDGRDAFPFSIADRELVGESASIRYFLKILDLPGSRLTASQVLNILESEAVRARFQIAASDLETIHDWMRSANICWGLNSRHRERLDTPATRQNTWEFGTDRMLLGLAMPESDGPFRGILPLGEIEGSNALILGNFLDFFFKLKSLLQEEDGADENLLLEAERSLGEWGDYFQSLIGDFFLTEDERQKENEILNDIFRGLKILEEKGGLKLKIDFEVIKEYITANLKGVKMENRFMSGGATFCSMLPMRSIPFKVIVLLGMNDREFPRTNKNFSFDLMLKKPMPGDRNVADEDRYLFLEALLAARKALYISYVGQDARNNDFILPAAPVNELLYYLDKAFLPPEGKTRDYILTRHQLQSFSPAYFQNDESKVSYSEENLVATRTLLDPLKKGAGEFIRDLPEPEEEWKTVAPEQLAAFFGNPTRFLIKRRLGISLEAETDFPPDTEPFSLEGLERYKIRRKLLEGFLEGREADEMREELKAEGILPLKAVGEYYFELLRKQSEILAEAVEHYTKDGKLSPFRADIATGDMRIKGDIASVLDGRLINWRGADITTKDKIGNWIEHLILNCAKGDEFSGSVLIGFKDVKKDAAVVCLIAEPVREPKKILDRLLEYYWRGLREPLPFFPRSSAAYAETLDKTEGDEKKAFKAALRVWEGSPNFPGEREDPYFRKAFGDASPLDRTFQNIAVDILSPLLGSIDEQLPFGE